MQRKPLIVTSLPEALQACSAVIACAPGTVLPNLPTPKGELGGATRWHDFETEAWIAGEAIRRWLAANRKMRRDPIVNQNLIDVIKKPEIRRGRQSFFMCLGSGAKQFSATVANYLGDDDVCGHAASALIRMRAFEYAGEMDELLIHRSLHIRMIAERYLARCRNQI